jgi:hypothetical protein
MVEMVMKHCWLSRKILSMGLVKKRPNCRVILKLLRAKLAKFRM